MDRGQLERNEVSMGHKQRSGGSPLWICLLTLDSGCSCVFMEHSRNLQVFLLQGPGLSLHCSKFRIYSPKVSTPGFWPQDQSLDGGEGSVMYQFPFFLL